ncbi:ABC transporter ATP-binding protein [bacterium]|nr:ABC transporter ATP-binding protein [bacterium]
MLIIVTENPINDKIQPSIIFSGVKKQYGSVNALDNLDLELFPGELFAFLGPNGAGKTTAMKIAAGLVKPSSGSVLICGYDIQKQPLEAKKNSGYVPDSPYIYESLTGREFLHFCAGLYKLEHSFTLERVKKLQSDFGIGAWIDKRIGEYSHGMKQRVVMASAFVHNPKIALIDEPMVGLDPAAAKLVKKAMIEFCKSGGTLFFSTHTLTVAEEICDKVGIIHKGKLALLGSVKELSTDSGGLEEAFFNITAIGESA